MRRCVSIPILCAAWLVLLFSAPGLLALAVLIDVFWPKPTAVCRTLLLLLFFLTMEIAGVCGAVALGVARFAGMGETDYMQRNYELQWWWANILARAGIYLFKLRLDVEMDEIGSDRPVILLVRHSSVLDTVLVAHLIGSKKRMPMRYVLKRELLWDPCLDLVGNRLPNYFVERNVVDSENEVLGIQSLTQELPAGQGVVIYPEGTRFTPAKRARLLEKSIAQNDARFRECVERFHHVLPPRMGGTLALIEARSDARVIVCAHRGFESATSLWSLAKGSLVNKRIDVAFWEVSRDGVPSDHSSRIDWLLNLWDRVDAYASGELAE